MSTKSEPLIQFDLRQLSLRSLIILSTITIFVISVQFLVQRELQAQSASADIINIAGRQRMLSQRIAKDALALQYMTNQTARDSYLHELQESLDTWQKVATSLQAGALPGGNSPQITAQFAEIQSDYDSMLAAANCLTKVAAGASTAPACGQDMNGNVRTILDHENAFLTGMDAIVRQYQAEGDARIVQLRLLQIVMVLLVVALLLLHRLTVFRLSMRKIKQEASDLIQVQEELKLSEQHYRLLMENSTDVISQHTPDGIFTYVSPACVKLFGYEPKELIGRSVFEYLYPADMRYSTVAQPNMLDLPEAEAFSYRTRRKDGSLSWVETTVHRISTSDAGARPEIVAVTRDVSERKRAEAIIRQLAQFQQAILDSANFSIIATDVNGLIQTFNVTAQDWLGYSADEMIGKQTPIIIHDAEEISDRAELLTIQLGTEIKPGFEVFVASAQKGVVDESEWTYICKDGTRLPIQLSVTALHDDQGIVTGYLAIGSNITERKEAEQTVKELIVRYQALFEYAEDSIFIVDPEDFRFLDVNQNAAKRLGYTREELLRITALDINPPEDASHVQEIGKHLMAHGDAVFERYHIRKDGTLLPVEVSSRVIHYGNHQVIQSFARDITRRKAAEEALRQSEEHVHLMIDAVVDYAIFTLDTEGCVTTWNTGAQRIKGYSADDIIGQHFSRFYSPEDRANGKPDRELVIASTEGRSEDEGWRIRKDGSKFWANVIITPLRDSTGQLRGFSKVTRDITEKKVAEQLLQESETRYRSVIESMAEGVTVQDANGVIRTCNSSSERILGLSAEQIMGFSSFDPRWKASNEDGTPLPAAERPSVITLRTGEPRSNVVMGIHKSDGTLTWVSASTQPLFYAGDTTPNGVVTTFVDITERKHFEQDLAQARDAALEASRLKSTFLATMSHEIRTPLNGVIGMIELLLDSTIDEQQRKMLEVMQTSGHTLLSIINDTLDFSKIEAGRVVLEQRDFEPLRVIEGVVMVLASQAQSKLLSLMTLVEPDVPTILNGDDTRLYQVLFNLIGNAIKFTEQGEILVHAMLEQATPTQATVRFSVSDTGIGLSVEARSHLFQPFIQADDSTTRKYGGTGLGLAISKRLIELMGGEIGLESDPGQGATFWMRIPFVIPPTAPQISITAEPEPDLQATKVLIVDDSTSARLILNRYLSKLKARSGTASSAKRALEELHKAVSANDPYDAAVIDLVMPEMDGIDLARAIKQDPAIANTPLILITAFNTHEHKPHAMEAGFVAYLSKPVRQIHLYEAIKERNTPHKTIEVDSKSVFATLNPFAASQRILLAEDNQINQLVASMQLERLGYKVDLVTTGVEAFNVSGEKAYNLILMDCNMPDMDGFEATRLIRQREVGTQTHVQIVAMTANAMQGDREACLKAGMDDYLPKPIALTDLKRILDYWLNPDGSVVPIPVSLPGESRPLVTLDAEALDNLCKLSKRSKPVVLRKLVDNFLSNTPTLLVDLRLAANDEDKAALQRAAHTLKSSSASYGAMRLAELCRILETAARNGEVQSGTQRVEEIEAEYANVKIALELQLQEGI